MPAGALDAAARERDERAQTAATTQRADSEQRAAADAAPPQLVERVASFGAEGSPAATVGALVQEAGLGLQARFGNQATVALIERQRAQRSAESGRGGGENPPAPPSAAAPETAPVRQPAAAPASEATLDAQPGGASPPEAAPRAGEPPDPTVSADPTSSETSDTDAAKADRPDADAPSAEVVFPTDVLTLSPRRTGAPSAPPGVGSDGAPAPAEPTSTSALPPTAATTATPTATTGLGAAASSTFRRVRVPSNPFGTAGGDGSPTDATATPASDAGAQSAPGRRPPADDGGADPAAAAGNEHAPTNAPAPDDPTPAVPSGPIVVARSTPPSSTGPLAPQRANPAPATGAGATPPPVAAGAGNAAPVSKPTEGAGGTAGQPGALADTPAADAAPPDATESALPQLNRQTVVPELDRVIGTGGAAGGAPKGRPTGGRRGGGGGSGGGGGRRAGGGDPLAKWKASATQKVAGITEPDTAAVAQSGKTLADAGKSTVDGRKAAKPDAKAEAKAAVPAPPTAEQPLPAPEPDPVPEAKTLLDTEAAKRLPDQTLPSPVRSPGYAVKGIPSRLPGDIPAPPPRAPEAAKPGGAADPAAGKGDADPKAKEAVTKAAGARDEAPRSGQGEAATLHDDGPPSPAPLPAAQASDIAESVARVLAQSTQLATQFVGAAEKAAFPQDALKKAAPQLALDQQPTLKGEIETELRSVAEAAGVTGKELDSKVETQRQKLLDDEKAGHEHLANAATQAKTETERQGKTEVDDIATAGETVRADAKAREEASQGAANPEVVRSKRDRMKGTVNQREADIAAGFKASKQRRVEALEQGGTKLAASYRTGSTNEAGLIRNTFEDPAGDEARRASAPSLEWGRTQATGVSGAIDRLKAAVTTSEGEFQTSLSTNAEKARGLIESWATARLDEEESWWDRLVRSFREWGQQVDTKSKAWEQTKNRETRDSLARDFAFLAQTRDTLASGNRDAIRAATTGLSKEQQAILQAFLAGGDSIAAVAAGLIARLEGERVPDVTDDLRSAAEGLDSLSALTTLGEAQTAGFNPQLYAHQIHNAIDGMGTNEQRLFGALSGKTTIQVKAIEAQYRAEFGGNMRADIADDLSGAEAKRAEALLAGDVNAAAAAELNEALSGAGTDEKAVWRLLRNKTPEERAAIEAAYKANFGADLRNDLIDDMEGNELDRATALLDGDTSRADAIAVDEAMHGTTLGIDVGTDEDAVNAVYEQNRSEVEAEAARRGWNTEQMQAELKRRNAAITSSYGQQFANGDPGALDKALADELSDAELDLARAHVAGDAAKVDAAKLAVEKESLYVDDDVVNSVLRNQHARAEADVKRDLAAESRDLANDPLLSKEQKEERLKALKDGAEAKIATQAEKNMGALAKDFGAYGHGSLDRLVLLDTQGDAGAMARELHTGNGKLSDAAEIDYAVRGAGTDEAAMRKALQGKSPAEIAELAKQYKARTGRELRTDVMGEVSGREGLEFDLLLEGEPQTPEARMAQLRKRKEWETGDGSGVMTDLLSAFGDDERDVLDKTYAQSEAAYDSYQQAVKLHGPDSPEAKAALEKFDKTREVLDFDITAHQEAVDAVTDAIVNVGAAAAGITVTILTAGTAAPALVALAAAMASMAVTVTGKAILKGPNAYGLEEYATDVASGMVDGLVGAATAGMADKLLKAAGPLLTKLMESGAGKVAMAELADAVENVVGGLPTAVLGVLVDDNTWASGDPLAAITAAMGSSAGMAVGMGAVMKHAGGPVMDSLSSKVKTKVDAAAAPHAGGAAPHADAATPHAETAAPRGDAASAGSDVDGDPVIDLDEPVVVAAPVAPTRTRPAPAAGAPEPVAPRPTGDQLPPRSTEPIPPRSTEAVPAPANEPIPARHTDASPSRPTEPVAPRAAEPVAAPTGPRSPGAPKPAADAPAPHATGEQPAAEVRAPAEHGAPTGTTAAPGSDATPARVQAESNSVPDGEVAARAETEVSTPRAADDAPAPTTEGQEVLPATTANGQAATKPAEGAGAGKPSGPARAGDKLDPDAIVAEHGIPKGNQEAFQGMCDMLGIVVDVRPSNPEAPKWLAEGALPKPEAIKSKTINDIDVHLGADPSSKGLVGFFEPTMPTPEALAAMSPELRAKVEKRYAQRLDEQSLYGEKMHKMEKEGLIEIGEGGVVRGMAPNGEMRPFTGDHDLFDIRMADGSPVPPEVYDAALAMMRGSGMAVEHGAHMKWEPKSASDQAIFDHIVGRHQGEEPLIRFGPRQEPSVAFADTPVTPAPPPRNRREEPFKVEQVAPRTDQPVAASAPAAATTATTAHPDGSPGTGEPTVRTPADPHADPQADDAGVIDLDDPANAHLVESVDGVDARQPHVGEDGAIDLDDPRNRFLLEDRMAAQLPVTERADPAANRAFFEDFVRAQPELESALLRNSVTGDHIVVQGTPDSVGLAPGSGVWEQLIPEHLRGTGQWDLVVHSHPIDPATGVTPDWARLPSGGSGDFGWAAYESAVRGGPVSNDIHITTEHGPDVTRYGYDPDHEQPYSIDYPKADGTRETQRFASIEDYHDWYASTIPRGDLGAVPTDFGGYRRPDIVDEATASPTTATQAGPRAPEAPRPDAPTTDAPTTAAPEGAEVPGTVANEPAAVEAVPTTDTPAEVDPGDADLAAAGLDADPTVQTPEAYLTAAGLPADDLGKLQGAQPAELASTLPRWNVGADGRNQAVPHVLDYARGYVPGKEQRLGKFAEYGLGGPFDVNDPLVIPKVTATMDGLVAVASANAAQQVRAVGGKVFYFVPKGGATPGPNGFSNSQKGMLIVTYGGKFSSFWNTTYGKFKVQE